MVIIKWIWCFNSYGTWFLIITGSCFFSTWSGFLAKGSSFFTNCSDFFSTGSGFAAINGSRLYNSGSGIMHLLASFCWISWNLLSNVNCPIPISSFFWLLLLVLSTGGFGAGLITGSGCCFAAWTGVFLSTGFGGVLFFDLIFSFASGIMVVSNS